MGMPTTFANAPLLEIVAELKWAHPIADAIAKAPHGFSAIPVSALTAGGQSEFYKRMADAVAQIGFHRSERLLPEAFPAIPHQTVYRFRRQKGSELLQVGPGLFSANAVPPYRSWTEFEPIVAQGVACLLESRSATEKSAPFTGVSLRYIDGFKQQHTGGRNARAFIREVLGFDVVLPSAVTRHGRQGAVPSVVFKITMPVSDNLEMALTLGEGVADNEPALVMDTTVASTIPVAADQQAVMASLRASREIIHDMFMRLVEKVHGELKPLEA